MRWTIGIATGLLALWLAYAVWPLFTVYRLDLLQNGRPSGVFSDSVLSIEGLSSEALGNPWRVYANSELGLARFFVAVPVDKPPMESSAWRRKYRRANNDDSLAFRLALAARHESPIEERDLRVQT